MSIIKSSSNAHNNSFNIKIPVLCGFFGIIVMLMLILFFSLISVYVLKSDTYSLLFSRITLYLSAFIGGFTSCINKKNNGLKYGLACGIVYSLFLCIFSLFVKDFKMSFVFISKILLICFSSAIGGIISVNIFYKKKKKYWIFSTYVLY